MFTGSLVALVTPMKKNGDVDYAAFDQLIDWHLTSGTHGLVILGTTGESPTIDLEERTHLIKQTIARVNHQIPVIVGTGANSTAQTILLTQQAKDLGADAVLLVTPYYNRPTQEGLFLHFSAIADAVEIPQILYNVPTRTACDLLPETVLRLAAHPNIVGLKEASGDIQRLTYLREHLCDLAVYSGDDGLGLAFMQKGAQGVISVVANIAPKLFATLCHLALEGDHEQALILDNRLRPLYKSLFLEANPIPSKWLLAKMGLIQAGIRLPLTPLSMQYQAVVLASAKEAGLID